MTTPGGGEGQLPEAAGHLLEDGGTRSDGKEEQPLGEPAVECEEGEPDRVLNPSSPEQTPDSASHEGRRRVEEATDGRRYLSCMKNRRNPLLMDMPEVDGSSPASSPLSLQCLQCHIIFNNYKSKERHLRSTHPLEYQQCTLKNTLFTCYVCDHHFANSTELMAHQKAHVEKRPYKCPICGQAFYRVSELTRHKKSHFGEDGYACTACGKACKTLTLLKYHQRKHTGEKPHACKECGKRFGFPKDVRKHMESHLEGEDGANPTPKPQHKKRNSNTGATTTKYPCSLCKATFKTTKTRLYHMKKKHKLLLDTATDALPPRHPVKQGGPIITPISISQSTLLQVEPIGPLQQVNANIDTEQIRKLIESLENVQKVNQVVILGQVPPYTPTQGLQVTGPGGPIYLNPTPPSMEHSQSEHSNCVEMHHEKDTCNFMDQTIILEPITPPNEGLEYPSFQELVSQRQSEVADLKLNPEEAVVLELTSALLPVADLEKTESSPQHEVQSPSLVPTTELEKSMDESVNDQEGINPPVQPPVPTVEPDKTPVQAEQEDLHNGLFAPKDTLTQIPYESHNNPKGDSQIQKESIEEAHSGMESMPVEETEQNNNAKTCEEKPKQLLTAENPSQEQVQLHPEPKQVESTLDSAVNVMSAQELVKVRKRRPARTFVYEEYIYQQMGSTRKRHLHTGETPAKRQPTKKSHHVIEFGPKKKNQKQRKRSQSCPSPQEVITGSKMFFANMSEKPLTPKKKGRKSKKDKEVHLSSANSLATPVDAQEQQSKENKRNKLKKRKDVAAGKVAKKQDDLPARKKNKIEKVPSTKLIDLNILEKYEKVTKEKDPNTQNTKITVASINVPVRETTPDPFLLLKGHKQPQLKVYKLDPSKAAGQTQESTQANDGQNILSTVVRKRAGRPKKTQKAYSLLSSLVVNDPSPKTPCTPNTTRKRRSSLRIETEGVITASHSKRALECKDCGEKFNSVSSLQEHKTTMHIVESPGLTFTNGNLFEGVSSLLYQPAKKAEGVIGAVNGPSYWDTEAEMREVALEDKECSVSFPALNPSPSLPVTDAVEASGSQDNTGQTYVADITASLDVAKRHTEQLSGTSLGVLSPGCANVEATETLQSNNKESPSCMSVTLVNGPPQPNSPSAEGSLASDLGNPLCQTSEDNGLNGPSNHDSGTEMKFIVEEDMKDDVLLDVDVVTIGEQNDLDQPDFTHNPCSQHDLIGDGNREVANPGVSCIQINNEKTNEVTFRSSSSSTHSLDFKKEQVETAIQRREDSVVRAVGRVSGVRGRGRGRRGSLIRGMISRRNSEGANFSTRKADREPDECQIIFQRCPLGTDSELNKQNDSSSVQHSQSTPEVVEKRSESGVEEQDKDIGQSAVVIPERIATSRLRETTEDTCRLGCVPGMMLGQVLDSEKIKVEDGTTGIRTVLVKQESRLILSNSPASQGNVIIQWNVEQMDSENIPGTETDSHATSMAADIHTQQCVFYPVKEEEREVLLGPSRRDDGLGVSSQAKVDHQTEGQQDHVGHYEENLSTRDLQEIRSGDVSFSTDTNDSNTAQGDIAEQENPQVHTFLLQSCEEDDSDVLEYCDRLPAPEAQAVAYLNSLPRQLKENTDILTTAVVHQEDVREPIDYFSTYFGWDTWGEIAQSTNKQSNMLHPVTAKEVAQFVGIHIAMGTLKFPSLRLYWQDLTKVPLIAEAMPLPRFLQLSHKLKLALPERDSTGKLATQPTTERQVRNLKSGQPTTQGTFSSSDGSSCRRCHSNNSEDESGSQKHGGDPSNCNTEMNPLWRLQPMLHRFHAGCQLLTPEEEYGVDQFPIPLTGKVNDDVCTLHCTVFIGVGGLITKLQLRMNLSDKEDVVERMAPKDSLVFLCRQHLSTPAMLERLLDAGVHGAGMVGGAMGQMGDEFVSSDGRLMLRRSKGGFVLSTVRKEEQNVAQLIENLERAQMLVCLNRDLQNLYRIPHMVTAPTCWPQGVLWFLTDLALVNSWLLYRQAQQTGSEPLTFMAFRLEVSKALIFSSGLDTQDPVPPDPPAQSACVAAESPDLDVQRELSLPDASVRYDGSGHWPEQFEEGEGGRCRFGNCDRTSQVRCLKCCVFLCISRHHNCFMKFHSQEQ